MAIKILLADDCADTRSSMRKLIELESSFEVIGEAENGAQALEKAVKLQPDVVLMDVNMPVMNGIEATEKITLQCPKTAVVMCSVQGERDYLRQAMASGAKDYLTKPIDTDQLLDAVQKVCDLEKKRQQKAKHDYLEDNLTVKSQTVALISSKGGVGKSTISVNLGAAAARLGKSVCIVDLDLQFGDIALLLSLSNVRRNIYTLTQENNVIDSEVIKPYLLEHESGVKILAAPIRPEEGEYIGIDAAVEILATLSEMFELVIVDTAPVTNDLFFAILEQADLVGVVSTPSLPILKNNHNLLQLLDSLHVDKEKIKILLNRSYSKTGVRQRDVIEVLKQDLFWEMANDFSFVDSSVNEGVPFAYVDPEHRLSRQIESLCTLLTGESKRRTEKGKGKKRLFKLFG
ncbi:MAG TPA: response regulator [Bacilli bacterium]|nr:response regulator [Bacilli bacterium]